PGICANDRNHLFWGSKSHAKLGGSHRRGLHCLDIQTRKWADSPLVLWDCVEDNVGSGICFEIIDGQSHCVSNTLIIQADDGIWKNVYQVSRFPAANASYDKCEKPWLCSLWRRH
ncbi:hypothetical protein IWW34DRAFT_565453, partial [Fusarium oxysporum f. sp. albedinis]